jgi:phosphatidylserine decarboxylase
LHEACIIQCVRCGKGEVSGAAPSSADNLQLAISKPVLRGPQVMVRDAYKFLLPAVMLGIAGVLLNLPYAAALFFVLAAFICFFFRNPDRKIPNESNLIVSPADGKVVRIAQETAGEQTISIFLSIFNVHVNRSPISGELEQLEYKRGEFKVAYDEEASLVNEQNILTIKGAGIQVIVRQIAGLIARRVICWKRPGTALQRGELFGLIRFGSRVDIVLPDRVKILVKVGDHVQGGSSVIGEYA